MSHEKICLVEGCERPHYARGCCKKHYQNARRNNGKLLASTRPNVNSREPKMCSVKGCDNLMYLKGYCRNTL